MKVSRDEKRKGVKDMARQIIFHKYQGTENGFLIYDIRKNGGEMNDGLLHMIRSRNFGLDLDGILVGPYLVDGSLEMKMFDRQGHEVSMKKESTDVPISYMKEAGYLPGECPQTEQRPEKIYCWC